MCTVVAASKPQEALELALSSATRLVEIRADYLGEQEAERALPSIVRAAKEAGKLVVVTLRSAEEGGLYFGGDEKKSKILLKVSEARPAFVDVEARFALAAEVVSKLKPAGVGTIVSCHFMDGTPARAALEKAVEEALEIGADVAKVVARASSVADNVPALKLCYERPGKVISFCMGRLGIPSRLLAPACGAPFTYARHDLGAGTAEGQLSASEVLALWRKLGLAP